MEILFYFKKFFLKHWDFKQEFGIEDLVVESGT